MPPSSASAFSISMVAALAALSPAAAASNEVCPAQDKMRGNNPPMPFSDLKPSAVLPTIVESTNVPATYKTMITEAFQTVVDFVGGASDTYAFLAERKGAEAVYAGMEATFTKMAGTDKGAAYFQDFRKQAIAGEEVFFKGGGGMGCACENPKETAAGLYFTIDKDSTPNKNGIGEIAMHEMAHVYQSMKGGYAPTWLQEGGAVHMVCVLRQNFMNETYSQCFKSGGGRQGVIPDFLKYYASPYGKTNGIAKSGENTCLSVAALNDLCGTTDPDSVIDKDVQNNAAYLRYDVGAVAIAWAIHKSGKTSEQFWRGTGSNGFWNSIQPLPKYDYLKGLPGDCPEDKGWKGAFLNFTGTYKTMKEFYGAFDTWAKTANETDVLAILESDASIKTMTATKYDVSKSTWKNPDPCAGYTASTPTPTPAPDALKNSNSTSSAPPDGISQRTLLGASFAVALAHFS